MYFRCRDCNKRYDLDYLGYRCSCGGYLEAENEDFFEKKDLSGRDKTIWRYKEAIGLPESFNIVSLGEGMSPLLENDFDGKKLRVKMDFIQPSGSFKDRGACIMVNYAKHHNVDLVIEDSSGNAGAAASAYCAAMGLKCRIYTPSYTPDGKLTQIRLYGSDVVKVEGTRGDTNDAALKAAEQPNVFYASHLWHPLFMQGMCTTAYEIWEQTHGDLPEYVLVPIGGGGNLEGVYMGFTLLKKAGYITDVPKIIGIQSENCAPIHRAFVEGLNTFADITVKQTVAEGISVPKPPRAAGILEAVRNSGGFTMAVNDADIIAATKKLFEHGIFAEPTSASTLAGWYNLDASKRDNCLILLTGSALKQTNKLAQIFPEDK